MGIRICCPSYFNNQINNIIEILPNTPTNVIALTVTTEAPGERVRIDSMVDTTIVTEAASVYGFAILYTLFRDTTPLVTVQLFQTNQVKRAGESATISDFPNITWTDVPPLPGTYTYRIEVQRSAVVQEENIFAVNVADRTLDAIVFPPVNP
jgi:hypothetical protein